MKYMRDRSCNTEKKKPKSNDYKNKSMDKLPSRAPYAFSKNMFPVSYVEESMKEVEGDFLNTKKVDDKEKEKEKVKKRGSKRCAECEGCQRKNDCLECKECKDKKVHGGPGILKMGCTLKKCRALKKVMATPGISSLSSIPVPTKTFQAVMINIKVS